LFVPSSEVIILLVDREQALETRYVPYLTRIVSPISDALIPAAIVLFAVIHEVPSPESSGRAEST
jgi:hypothetical protein